MVGEPLPLRAPRRRGHLTAPPPVNGAPPVRAAPPLGLLVANFLCFQAGWFACVLGAAHGRPWVGALAGLAIVAGWLAAAPRPGALALLLLVAGTIGWCWDSALTVLGLTSYAAGPLTPPMAPVWILALWLLLASTLHLSMRWLQERLVLAAALGAVAAPLAYLAGARLGAMTLPKMMPALAAQAVGWAVLLPVLLRVARRLDV